MDDKGVCFLERLLGMFEPEEGRWCTLLDQEQGRPETSSLTHARKNQYSPNRLRAWTRPEPGCTSSYRWYNHEHHHRTIRYVPPNDRHEDKDIEILAACNKVYQKAKSTNPARWPSGTTKNCEPITHVVLNPTR